MFGTRQGVNDIRYQAAAAERLFSIDYESDSVASGATANVAIEAGAYDIWVTCFAMTNVGNLSGKATAKIYSDSGYTSGDANTPHPRTIGGATFASVDSAAVVTTDATLSGSEVGIFTKRFTAEHAEATCPIRIKAGDVAIFEVTNDEATAQDLNLHINISVDAA